jgi:hypothetical protein
MIKEDYIHSPKCTNILCCANSNEYCYKLPENAIDDIICKIHMDEAEGIMEGDSNEKS